MQGLSWSSAFSPQSPQGTMQHVNKGRRPANRVDGPIRGSQNASVGSTVALAAMLPEPHMTQNATIGVVR